ncbi:MAG: enoyl-CoA hydratase/isomerase family protein [Deltaproteobacteria bacterium]|nr:enoyl-CoA hydratase/isomerase family protein [Deltaproteobacteria bacterium]
MDANYETLDLRRDGGLLWLVLNRPHALNALNRTLIDELHAVLNMLHDDQSIRVVILRGAGRAFCAGLDLKEANNAGTGKMSVAQGLRDQRRIAELAIKIHRAPQPFVAAVHGAASGGGFALALASDIRIAGESARMNAAFIRIGLSACDVGVSYFLPRIVGSSVASEFLLTGDFIDASRAVATGLVSRVVPDADLDRAAEAMARNILRNSPLGVRLTKECLRYSVDAPTLEAAIAMEDRNQILTTQTNDVHEGIAAFLEKREPKYEDA